MDRNQRAVVGLLANKQGEFADFTLDANRKDDGAVKLSIRIQPEDDLENKKQVMLEQLAGALQLEVADLQEDEDDVFTISVDNVAKVQGWMTDELDALDEDDEDDMVLLRQAGNVLIGADDILAEHEAVKEENEDGEVLLFADEDEYEDEEDEDADEHDALLGEQGVGPAVDGDQVEAGRGFDFVGVDDAFEAAVDPDRLPDDLLAPAAIPAVAVAEGDGVEDDDAVFGAAVDPDLLPDDLLAPAAPVAEDDGVEVHPAVPAAVPPVHDLDQPPVPASEGLLAAESMGRVQEIVTNNNWKMARSHEGTPNEQCEITFADKPGEKVTITKDKIKGTGNADDELVAVTKALLPNVPYVVLSNKNNNSARVAAVAKRMLAQNILFDVRGDLDGVMGHLTVAEKGQYAKLVAANQANLPQRLQQAGAIAGAAVPPPVPAGGGVPQRPGAGRDGNAVPPAILPKQLPDGLLQAAPKPAPPKGGPNVDAVADPLARPAVVPPQKIHPGRLLGG